MFTRDFLTGRKMLLTTILAGLIIALIAGGLQFMLLQQKREARFDVIINDLHSYLENYFDNLRHTINALQPLALSPCKDITTELTSRAAFSVNVRAFLLVKDGIAFCSSATGVMDKPLSELVDAININKDIDMAILPGTPMMPDKPAIALWIRNPLQEQHGIFTTINANLIPQLPYSTSENDFAGIALVVNHKALSTFSDHLINPERPGLTPSRRAHVEGLPLDVYLYAGKLPEESINLILLTGSLVGLIGGILSFYFLTVHLRPGKEILTAIKREQFYVVYQPVIDTPTMQIQGVEVLMRWKHPVAGEIPPDTFINFAEEQQLIVPLTHHLFRLIARDAPKLQTILPPGARLSINIAPSHLHAESFQQDMRNLSASLPANYFQIILEITERGMLRYSEASRLFKWLHDEGFKIAIDDFGTGHSSLIYLERFTFDYLKIDRGFISTIGTGTVTSPVLDAVLTLANRLDMVMVAEGVETQEQANWLREQGVHFLQGYWISRPLLLQQLVEQHDAQEKYFTSS